MSLFSVDARLPYLNRSSGKIGVKRILFLTKKVLLSHTLYLPLPPVSFLIHISPRETS